MANEATLVFQIDQPIPFTVADNTAITKGCVLTLSDLMTAAASGGTSGSAVAGIAAADKIANDGVTRLGVYREGVFKVYASGSVTAGDPLVTWGNFFSTAAINAEAVAGTSFETATNGESFLMELKPITMQLA